MMNRYKRSFASDNNAIVHPKVMEALQRVNTGHYISYGEDIHTEAALKRFQEVFGEETETYFVFNGTGANVLSLAAMGAPYQAVICAEAAHIHLDECGAPERFTGCKLLPLQTQNGKLQPEQIEKTLHVLGSEHHSQPGIVSLTQATEVGTVYTPEELRELTSFAHRHGLLVHMDGARIANAAAFLGVPLRAITGDAGIDVLSFGGTKNGLMLGEAVVFFRQEAARGFKFTRKQGMQLASKMRYIAAQFEALFTEDLWLENAKKANHMAALLAQGVSGLPGVTITRPVEANGVFVRLDRQAASRLMERYFFYCMDEEMGEYRWMTSFDTEEEDVIDFVAAVRETICTKA